MRLSKKFVVLAIILAFSAVLLAETGAFAQCPPAFHWSYRFSGCVPNGPPPGYYPPPPPPPPPAWGGRRCSWEYQNCVSACGGYPGCARRCNHRYNRCINGW